MTDQPAEPAVACPAQRSRYRQIIERIARVDTPPRTAAAFACGVFLSFSPFLGLQVILALGIAVSARFSRLALLAGLCTNLPWIMIPWYALTTTVAAAIMGTAIDGDIGASLARLTEIPVYTAGFWQQAGQMLAPFFWSFLIGSTLGAIIIAAVAYIVVLRVVTRIQMLPTRSPELVAD